MPSHSFQVIKRIIIDTPIKTAIYYSNGDIYVGEVIQGIKSGYGILIYDNEKSMYEGAWINNKRNGKGTQITKEGKYIGNFVG